jgi:hypothetical protein
VEEPEKVVVVEAPDDAGTPTWARCSVQACDAAEGTKSTSCAAIGARAGGVPEEPAGKGKTEIGGCTTGSENMDLMS